MRIVLGIAVILATGAALGGCVVYDAASTAAGAATTVVGTAADVGGTAVSTAADTVTGGSSDKKSGD